MRGFMIWFLLLSSCAPHDTGCYEFVGYTGTFEGDATGDVHLDVRGGDAESPATVAVWLDGYDGDPGYVLSSRGVGEVRCVDGALDASLNDEEGFHIGTFTGSLLEDFGSGVWDLDSGESGTWEAYGDPWY